MTRFTVLLSMLLLAVTTLSYSRAQASVVPDPWRFVDDGDLLSLIQAPSGPTEATGLFSFKCQKHSGKVEVMLVLLKQDLADVGDVIAKGDYPQFEMLPDETSFYFRIESNDFYGWTMTFDVDASSKFLEYLGQTGQIRYKLGQGVRQYGTAAGKEVIPAFLAGCRQS